MTSDEMRRSEQELIGELLGMSHFDDSVRQEHQGELRVKVMQAYHDSHRNAEAARPVVARRRKAALLAGFVAAVAVCLLGVVSLWPTADSDSVRGPVTEIQPGGSATVDPLLVQSLVEVDALREGVPAELLFEALAMCQQEHDARQLDSDVTQMRWHYESSLTTFPLESPKG